MTTVEPELVLAGEFPPPSRETWLGLVAKALDRTGALDEQAAIARLRSITYDGITIEPLYTAADADAAAPSGLPGAAPFVRGRTPGGTRDGGWDVRQRVDAVGRRGPRPRPSSSGAPRRCSSTCAR